MKQKTVKSASKRIIKITSKGKMIRRHMSAQHLAVGKSKRAKKNAHKTAVIAKSDVKKIKRMIPNR